MSYIGCKNFKDWAKSYTEAVDNALVLLRTVGPDNVTDDVKANQIYSAYYLNMQTEHPGIFDKLLYNEFTFVEFDTEQEALDFVIDNFPNTVTDDLDYFVQYVVFYSGAVIRTNNGLTGLAEPAPQPLE